MRGYDRKIGVLNFLVTGSLSVLALSVIALWFRTSPAEMIEMRVARPFDRYPSGIHPEKSDIKGFFQSFDGVPSEIKGEWANFRGKYHDNVSREEIPLKGSLDEDNLPVVWSVDLGMGYAGPSVANGRVYVLDHDNIAESDVLRCFSMDDGREIWRRSYRAAIKRNHGYSRTVPAVSGGYVVTIGPKGHVMCVDAITGDFKWGIDLEAEYGTEIPLWYTGQCPVIDGSYAVIAPAGKALMIGVDLETGEKIWETPNPLGVRMSHSSVIPMTLSGKKMYVYSAIGALLGISAEGDDVGKTLFSTEEWDHSVISPSPVKIGEDKILVTAGYGAGSMVFQIKEENGKFSAVKIMEIDKSVFACEQHTPIFYGGRVFSVLPSDAGELNRQLVCVRPDISLVWSSGRENRFGLGPFIIADGKIYVLDNDGVLTVADASSESYRQIGRVKVLKGHESWGPIAIAGGKMLVRDFERMVCIDLRGEHDGK